MTTTARGRHRKLRRNILHTVVATALLAGTFTVVDQVSDQKIANAVEITGQAGQLVFTASTSRNQIGRSITVGSNGNYYMSDTGGLQVFNASGVSQRSFNPGWTHSSAVTAGTVTPSKTNVPVAESNPTPFIKVPLFPYPLISYHVD